MVLGRDAGFLAESRLVSFSFCDLSWIVLQTKIVPEAHFFELAQSNTDFFLCRYVPLQNRAAYEYLLPLP